MLDYHIHTQISDGEASPDKTVDKLKELGVRRASITDHDSIKAYKILSQNSQKTSLDFDGLILETGVEIDCAFSPNISIEILGYGFNPQDKELNEYLSDIQEQRKSRISLYMQKINERFGQNTITGKEIFSEYTETYLKPHIIRPLLKKNIFKDYKEGNLFLKAIPDKLERIEAAKAIKMIHKAGGEAFLAHPGVYDFKYEDLVEIINKLLNKGLDGIETYYPYSLATHGKYTADTAREFITKMIKLFPDAKVSQGSDVHSIKELEILHSRRTEWAELM